MTLEAAIGAYDHHNGLMWPDSRLQQIADEFGIRVTPKLGDSLRSHMTVMMFTHWPNAEIVRRALRRLADQRLAERTRPV